MATVVEMPKLGNTVEECLLTAWRRREGESVAAGEVLADIETDKTTFELTAPVDGLLLVRLFEEGALIPVHTPVCVLGSAGEDVARYRPEGASPGPPAGVAPSSTPALGMGRAEGGPVSAAPARAPEAAAAGPEGGAATLGNLSPRARRYRREHGLVAEPAAGSGPRGRVTEADLRRLGDAGWQGRGSAENAAPAAAPAAAENADPASVLRAAENADSTSVLATAESRPPVAEAAGVELSLVRRTIARRLRESLSQTAQYTLHSSANAAALLAVRRRLKSSPETTGISIGDLVAYCAIRALLEVPAVNAELIDGILHVHRRVHLAFACDTPRGLVVPVVRDSQDLSLRELSQRFKELAAQAVQGTVAADDLSGGSFTVSNLGSLGIEAFTPVINPPQVAILGVDRIQVKPVRKGDGNIEFIDAIGLSLTVDHQVIDGAPGARFLRVLMDRIEEAESLCTT